MVSGIFVNESGRMLVSLFVWIGKRVTILLPIFFYHKLAQSLLTMGLGLVVTPPDAQHLIKTRSLLPDSVRYLVADGYYYRFKFWNAVRDADLNLIGKLRVDANLNYIYTGDRNKRGAPRKYDGKVDCNNLKKLTFIKEVKPGVKLYSLVVWSCC